VALMDDLRARPRRRTRARATSIELSQAQLEHVLRDASGSGGLSLALAGLSDVRAALARAQPLLEDSRLSRSLMLGVLLLAAFPADGSYIGNSELAHTLDLSASTTHRYVSTLLALGLVERDAATRKYRITHAD
jgi:predicted transcriptional regulator